MFIIKMKNAVESVNEIVLFHVERKDVERIQDTLPGHERLGSWIEEYKYNEQTTRLEKI